MARRRAYTGYRKPRTVGDGRSFGTAATRPRPKSDGPRKSELHAAEATAAVLEMFASDELPAMIATTTISRLEGLAPQANWSLGNQLLALKAGTADGRTFRDWKAVGRHVNKGARAFWIFEPRKCTFTEKDEQGDEEKRTAVVGFRPSPRFRFEDTSGFSIESDYRPANLPPLYEVAERLGVGVMYAACPGRWRGWYSPGEDRIVLCSTDERTYWHELAHAAHYRVRPELRGSDVAKDESYMEVVAELAAATLCHLYDVGGYLRYSKQYLERYDEAGKLRTSLKVLGDVQKVLTVILEPEEGAVPAVTEERELAAA